MENEITKVTYEIDKVNLPVQISDVKCVEMLIYEAEKARKNSYCPYSGYAVGAAILTRNGDVYTGCNIENAAYSPSVCAERTAVFKAVSEGQKEFSAIAIVGGKTDKDGSDETEYAYPCGVCRQVLSEFCNPNQFFVIIAKNRYDYRITSLESLLPHHFEL